MGVAGLTVAVTISSYLVWNMASNSRTGLEWGIVFFCFISWLILKVGEPFQSVRRAVPMFGNHCTNIVILCGCRPSPQSLQHFRRPLKAQGPLESSSSLFAEKLFDWFDGLAVVLAVTFRTVKPQYPASARFHKCSQMKFVSLRFFGLIPNITVQTCSVASLQNSDLCTVLYISVMLVWETRGWHAVLPNSKTY